MKYEGDDEEEDDDDDELFFPEGSAEDDDLDFFEEELPTIDYNATKKKVSRQSKGRTSVQTTFQPIMQSSGTGIVFSLARAIQHHEGWFPPGPGSPKGSRSYRNNNPGNLRFVGQRGATGKDASGFAIFPNYSTGWAALLADLRAKLTRNPHLTIRELLGVYAPPSENDTGAYIQAVADELSLSPDVPLA